MAKNSSFFWHKLNGSEKATLVLAAFALLLLPVAMIASQSQTRTVPKAASIPTPPILPSIIPSPEKKFNRVLPVVGRIPKTPTIITGICQLNNQTINSNIAVNCPDPVFKWNSLSKGFFVYFGPKTPKQIDISKDGQFQAENTYAPTGLTNGQQYNLFIQETSDEGNLLWLSGGNITPNPAQTNGFILIVK